MQESFRSRSTFLVLLALDAGPKHGYEIARWVEERTGGFFTISFGALYPILHKLEEEGLIRGDWEDVGAAKRKKVYALSAAGKRQLKGERAHHEALMGAFARLLGAKT